MMKVAQQIIELSMLDLYFDPVIFKRAFSQIKENKKLKEEIMLNGLRSPVSITKKNFLLNMYHEIAIVKFLKIAFIPAIYIPYDLLEQEKIFILEHNFKKTLSKEMILSPIFKIKILSILFPLFYNLTGRVFNVNQQDLMMKVANYAVLSMRQIQRTKKIYQSALSIAGERKKEQFIKNIDIEKVIQSLNKSRKIKVFKKSDILFRRLEKFYAKQGKKRKKEIRAELKLLMKGKKNEIFYSEEYVN